MYKLLRSLLFRLDPEKAHHLSTAAGGLVQQMMPGTLSSKYRFEHDALRQSCLGRTFENPVGLAAGFDKNARLIPLWHQLGFGFAEIGSITAHPSKGNPTPRLFRLPHDRALINRMGLNNDGAEAIVKRVKEIELPPTFHLGINIAKTHDPDIMGTAALSDYRASYELAAPHAGYITLNISCPNTSSGKTFENPQALRSLLNEISEARAMLKDAPPLLVKLSPPHNDRVTFDSAVEQIVSISLNHNVDGFIATNTASDRQGCTTPEHALNRIGAGGLSGAPLRKRSSALVRYLYKLTDGNLPIIGVGGIDSAEAAYEKIRAGASLVQIYTGMVYEGPSLPKQIKKGLLDLLQADGFSKITEAIGAATRRPSHMDTR